MTDTTDKLSLQQLKDVRELCLPHTAWRSIIDELISARDQLEAERQRVDAVCRDIRIQANDLKSARTVNKVLQGELAALKAKLANPVVLPPVEIWQGVCLLCGKLHPTGLQCPMLRVTADKGIL